MTTAWTGQSHCVTSWGPRGSERLSPGGAPSRRQGFPSVGAAPAGGGEVAAGAPSAAARESLHGEAQGRRARPGRGLFSAPPASLASPERRGQGAWGSLVLFIPAGEPVAAAALRGPRSVLSRGARAVASHEAKTPARVAGQVGAAAARRRDAQNVFGSSASPSVDEARSRARPDR